MAEDIKAYELAKKQREISISEFFLKNRHLLGFDNPTRALMMVVKEAVDNSLDACTEMKALPEIRVEMQQISENRFNVIVEDNGPGIVRQQIPNIFGKLLYGSKFHTLKQNRGQQGIGISAAVLYSQLTTGKSTKIYSRISPKKHSHYFELQIDTKKNEPNIIKDVEIEWSKDHGTKIEIEIEGRYLKGKQSVDEYIKQTAIVNPHATFIYVNPEKEKFEYLRATEKLPHEAKEIKPHPYGIELGQLMKMLQDTRANTLQGFLHGEFSRIGDMTSKEICEKAKLKPDDKPKRIDYKQIELLFKSLQEVKIMAPPSDCLSPITSELLEKGLRKEINADFYVTTTRSPSVYRGMPFIVECCTGDSKIVLENGTIMNIKDYVENRYTDKRVFSLDNNLKIVPSKVLIVHKFKNEHKIFKITTRTGRSLKLTSNNEIPIIENGDLIWKKAEDVMAGEFIAVPRILRIYNEIPNIIDLLNHNQVKVINLGLMSSMLNSLKEKYGSYKKASSILNINYNIFKAYIRPKNPSRPTLSIINRISEDLNLNFRDIKDKINYIRIVDNKFTNPHIMKVPEINEDLLYILGLLNSDGYISRKNISFVNLDGHLHNMYKEKMYNLFNIEVKRDKNNSYLCNKTLYILLKEIEKIISNLPDNLVISWLKGFVDGDGWVSLNKNKINRIGIATAKIEKAEFVQTMLLRLGIISKIEKENIPKSFGKIGNRIIKTKSVKYDIIINNIENIKKFHTLISFRQVKRENVLLYGIKNIRDGSSNRDVIPIGLCLSKFREENSLFQYQLGFSDNTIRRVEKDNQYLTRIHLQEILSSRNDFSGESLKKLILLAHSDVLCDKIVNIELVENEEYVYDLTVENGNFVAGNIIMHNCAVAFGGELEKESQARLMRFANRVPLLYQQGACAITEAVSETNWKSYGLNQSGNNLPVGPIIILVHMSSVWVPFTNEAKEAVAHYDEIIKEIKLALQECGRKLNIYINKNIKSKEQKEKINLFERYIPELASSLSKLTGNKKEEIEENLRKLLKKELPALEAENGAKE